MLTFLHFQIFLTMVKSDILPYKYANLCMVKNIWPHSKNIELSQKILNAIKFFFELADGLGISSLSEVSLFYYFWPDTLARC